MAAGEAGREEQAEAIIDLGPQIGDDQNGEGGHDAVLDHLGDHLIGQVGAHTGDVALGAALVHGEAVDADGGKDNHNKHRRIGADGAGQRQEAGEKIADRQPHKSREHTGGDEKALNKANLCADQLPQHDKYGGHGEIQ